MKNHITNNKKKQFKRERSSKKMAESLINSKNTVSMRAAD